MEHAPNPLAVLHVNGLIQAVALLKLINSSLIPRALLLQLLHIGGEEVARGQLNDGEGDNGDSDQGGNHERGAADDKLEHSCLPEPRVAEPPGPTGEIWRHRWLTIAALPPGSTVEDATAATTDSMALQADTVTAQSGRHCFPAPDLYRSKRTGLAPTERECARVRPVARKAESLPLAVIGPASAPRAKQARCDERRRRIGRETGRTRVVEGTAPRLLGV